MSTTQETAQEVEPAPRGGVSDVVREFRGPLLLMLLAVLLAAGSGWFLVQSLHGGPGTNDALVDRGATNRVIGDVSDGLDQIFSYSYQDIDATRRAAAAVLTGRAAGQYETLFGQVRQHAVAQQLRLTSRVVAAGVTQLDGDRARLLVFLDQTATRGATGRTATSAAQLSIGARLVGHHWLINDIHAR